MPESAEGIRFLVVDDLIQINRRLIEMQTPDEPVGVLSRDMLESAQQRPAQYRCMAQTEDVITLAAVLGDSIARYHAFQNANKRTAAAAVSMFLLLNGIELTAPDHEFADTVVDLVTGAVSMREFEDWLYYWHRAVDTYELNYSDAFERLSARWRIE